MLVVDFESFPPGSQTQVYFRYSQRKFTAKGESIIEILKHCKFTPFCLNNQILLMLDTLGVPEDPFKGLVQNELATLGSIFESRAAALRFLEYCSSLSPTLGLVIQLIRYGFLPRRDNFLRNTLEHLRRWFWRDRMLSFKIPISEGAILFGVFDETRTLRYDNGEGIPEVYIKVNASTRQLIRQRRQRVRKRNELTLMSLQNAFMVTDEDTDFMGDGPIIPGGGLNRSAALQEDELLDAMAARPDKWTSTEGENLIFEGEVITGYVLLTKCPVTHPGDIIVAKAVDEPQLGHMVNVLVLPGPTVKMEARKTPDWGVEVHTRHPGYSMDRYWTGKRPISNMLSGSDLDGDEYHIIWRKDIVDPVLKAHLASQFCRNPPARFFLPGYEDPSTEDTPALETKTTEDFYHAYQRNANLGRIAVAQLSQAHQPVNYITEEWSSDSPPKPPPVLYKGATDVCLQLSRLHSDAVDFGKTQKPAILDPKLRPGKNPHFMDPLRTVSAQVLI